MSWYQNFNLECVQTHNMVVMIQPKSHTVHKAGRELIGLSIILKCHNQLLINWDWANKHPKRTPHQQI